MERFYPSESLAGFPVPVDAYLRGKQVQPGTFSAQQLNHMPPHMAHMTQQRPLYMLPTSRPVVAPPPGAPMPPNAYPHYFNNPHVRMLQPRAPERPSVYFSSDSVNNETKRGDPSGNVAPYLSLLRSTPPTSFPLLQTLSSGPAKVFDHEEDKPSSSDTSSPSPAVALPATGLSSAELKRQRMKILAQSAMFHRPVRLDYPSPQILSAEIYKAFVGHELVAHQLPSLCDLSWSTFDQKTIAKYTLPAVLHKHLQTQPEVEKSRATIRDFVRSARRLRSVKLELSKKPSLAPEIVFSGLATSLSRWRWDAQKEETAGSLRALYMASETLPAAGQSTTQFSPLMRNESNERGSQENQQLSTNVNSSSKDTVSCLARRSSDFMMTTTNFEETWSSSSFANADGTSLPSVSSAWDVAFLERIDVARDVESSPLWGEPEDTLGGRVSRIRYLLLEEEPQVPPPFGWGDDWSLLFRQVDTESAALVRRDLAIRRGLSAYRISNPFHRALAFGSLILDPNDDTLFLTSVSSGHPRFAKHVKPTSPSSSFPTIHEELSFAAARQLELAEADLDSLSSSSSSMSGIIDEGAQLGQGATELAGTQREGAGEEASLFADKKLQLKKRRQEKEQRIRLALMGLTPQTSSAMAVAAAADDASLKLHQQQSTDQLPAVAMPVVNELNAVEIYRDLRRKYRKCPPAARLGLISFDAEQAQRDPYMVQARSGTEVRHHLELRHSDPALQFFGIPGRPFPVYVNRFHRPDFRVGLYESHRQDTKGPPDLYAGPHGGGLVVTLGKRPPSSVQGGTTASCLSGKLWGTWRVNGPQISDVMRRLKCIKAGGDVFSSIAPGGAEETAPTPNHPAELLNSVADLTLTDCAPIALLEYCEQSPPLLNNIGMVARITKYYRPAVESMTLEQAAKKIRGRLGRLGQLRLADTHIPFFGSQMRLTRNQGVVVLQSRLMKAPLFPHPTNPRSPLRPTPSTFADDWRYGTGRFHDFRGTDFLLIRRPVIRDDQENVPLECQSYLRPIYLEPPPTFERQSEEDEGATWYNRADCWVYTVGQTQPLVEVPPPTSKRCLEIRRDWLRAYALRLAREGLTDFQAVKTRCQEKFQSVFDPGVLQKHLLTCREATTSSSAPLFVAPGGPTLTIKLVDEEQLHSICSPEALCALEASLVANSLLSQAGITLLRLADGQLSAAVREIEADETVARENCFKARRQLKAAENRYRQILKSLPANHPLRTAAEHQEPSASLWELGGVGALGHAGTRRLSPIARLIEEMLLLTPWNITKDCLEVTTRQGNQFSLDGVGDPSGGRGEGVSLLKPQRREPFRDVTSYNRTTAESPKEDLRKLSMRELHDRLIKFGFDSQTVKSLPRWDQVALVRRFQCGNGRFDDDGALVRTGRMPNDAYLRRLNEIFLNQRRALEPEEPAMTASDSDGAHDDVATPRKRDTISDAPTTDAGGRDDPTVEEELFSGLELGSGDEDEERLAEVGHGDEDDDDGLRLGRAYWKY